MLAVPGFSFPGDRQRERPGLARGERDGAVVGGLNLGPRAAAWSEAACEARAVYLRSRGRALSATGFTNVLLRWCDRDHSNREAT